MTGLMDLPSNKESVSSSIFRYFHYFGTSVDAACQVHTDIGLLTLIPVSTLPSLEVLDCDTYEWYNFEAQLTNTHDVMVLMGETLERATAGFYRAVVHRLSMLSQPRFSLVYLMRARSDALLDPVGLDSPFVMCTADQQRPITAFQFMRSRYLGKKSTNLVNPGQGLPLINLVTAESEKEPPSKSELQKWSTLESRPDLY